MAVLGAVVGSMAAAYSVPRLSELAWKNAFTWVGKTAATWAAIAFVWDVFVNGGGGDDFDQMDLGISLLGALGARIILNKTQVM